MIELKVDCSMCGKELDPDLQIYTAKELVLLGISDRLKKRGWILQVNGGQIDTYCSLRCSGGQTSETKTEEVEK